MLVIIAVPNTTKSSEKLAIIAPAPVASFIEICAEMSAVMSAQAVIANKTVRTTQRHTKRRSSVHIFPAFLGSLCTDSDKLEKVPDFPTHSIPCLAR